MYRINVSQAKPAAETFFKSDEQHIRSLAWDKSGNLIAGTDGSGLVYRISPEGKGYVLFSAPRREITAVAVGADGTIYAADVGDKNHNPLPQLPVQNGNVGITISFVQPGSMQAANASTVLPEGTEIYALKPEQAPRKIWMGKDEIVYQLAATADGLTVLTGNRGRIFTIHADGGYSDVAHLDAQQAVAVAPLSGGFLVGTANTGKLYRLTSGTDAGLRSYASDVLDAGATSRWGRVEVEPGSRGYEIWTRSGNVEQPARSQKDWGWSDWQQAAGGKIASPAGRYLQWKATLVPDGEVSGVGVNYLPVNSAPVVDDLVVVPGARYTPQPQPAGQPGNVTIAFPNPAANSGATFDGNAANAAQPIQAQKDRTSVTVRWAAHDDDGDELSYDLYLRGDGETVWRPLKKGLTEKVYSFDGASFPDGGYRIKVVASDAPFAYAGRCAERRHGWREVRAGHDAAGHLGIEGECGGFAQMQGSALSAGLSGELRRQGFGLGNQPCGVLAGRRAVAVRGASRRPFRCHEEHYSVLVPLAASSDGTPATTEVEHLITIRVYDRHDNMAVAKVLVPASASAPASGRGK